jgi:uncharacterized protein YchJ
LDIEHFDFMDTRTGQLMTVEQLNSFPVEERRFFVPVKRDLTRVEEAKMKIKMYSPCGCGSGLKFKFCCFKK